MAKRQRGLTFEISGSGHPSPWFEAYALPIFYLLIPVGHKNMVTCDFFPE